MATEEIINEVHALVASSIEAERSRVIQLWELEMLCKCEDAMRHLLTRIKGETNG